MADILPIDRTSILLSRPNRARFSSRLSAYRIFNFIVLHFSWQACSNPIIHLQRAGYLAFQRGAASSNTVNVPKTIRIRPFPLSRLHCTWHRSGRPRSILELPNFNDLIGETSFSVRSKYACGKVAITFRAQTRKIGGHTRGNDFFVIRFDVRSANSPSFQPFP